MSRYENFFHSCVDPENKKFDIEKRLSRYDIDLLDSKNLKKIINNHLLTSQATSQNFSEEIPIDHYQNSHQSIEQTLKPVQYPDNAKDWRAYQRTSFEDITETKTRNKKIGAHRKHKLFIDLKMVEDISKLTGLGDEGGISNGPRNVKKYSKISSTS